MTKRCTYESPFTFGDRVTIDAAAGSIVDGVVIGLVFYPQGSELKVSWWNNGSLHEQWVAAWRCTPCR